MLYNKSSDEAEHVLIRIGKQREIFFRCWNTSTTINPEAEINKFSTWLQEHVMYIITSVLSTKYISRMSPNKANEVEKIISQKFAIFSPRPRMTYKRFTSQIYQGKPENKREVAHMFLVCILILLCICRCWLFSHKKIVKHRRIEIPQFSFMINQFLFYVSLQSSDAIYNFRLKTLFASLLTWLIWVPGVSFHDSRILKYFRIIASPSMEDVCHD